MNARVDIWADRERKTAEGVSTVQADRTDPNAVTRPGDQYDPFFARTAPQAAPAQVEAAKPKFSATPFAWRDPAAIPPREWLYGRHLIRKYASATIAPGGVGKSSLTIVDALAMATGLALSHDKPHQQLRVWIWNGEDPREEILRRVMATALHFRIASEQIGDRLFIDSGRDMPIIIGETNGGATKIAFPVIDALADAIKLRKIDVLIVDPFVSVHRLAENDNSAMDAAVKAFAQIADRTGCAIELVHHTRKLNGADADMEAARGGSSIAGAVRAARALNVMSPEIAKGFGMADDERRSFVRIDDAKANLAPPSSAKWFHLASVDLGNATNERPSDHVGVPEPWTPPDAFDGLTTDDLLAVQREIDGKGYRESVQAKDWVGYAIGRVLEIDTEEADGKARVKKLLKAWLSTGALKIETVRNTQKGRDTKVVGVGEWASSPP